MSKTDHLAKAKKYIAKGEDYYRKAAEEIVAAKQEDGLSNRQIGERLEKNESWVRRLLKSYESAPPGAAVEVDWEGGAKDQPATAKRVLKDPEQRKEVIDSLEEEEAIDLAGEVWEHAHDKASKRREKEPAPKPSKKADRTNLYLLRLNMKKVEITLQSAIRSAADVSWSDEESVKALERIAQSEELIDLLKQAVENTTDVDWDQAFAGLVGEEGAAT